MRGGRRSVFGEVAAAAAVVGIQVVFAGCRAAPSGTEGPAAVEVPVATVPASADTRAALGVTRWIAYASRGQVRLDGVSEGGALRARADIRQFSREVGTAGSGGHEGGYELSASTGEILRMTLGGEVLAYREDAGVLRALAVDLQPFSDARRTRTAYDCDTGAWLACGGTILVAVGACGGPEDLPCIGAALAATGTCYDCFTDGDNGKNPPPQTDPDPSDPDTSD